MSDPTPVVSAEVVEGIAAALGEHEYQVGPRLNQICSCGHTDRPKPGELWTLQDCHRAHVATVLAAREDALRRSAVEAVADDLASMAEVWGGDRAWLTTGTKVAEMTAERVRAYAAETYPTLKEPTSE